MNVVRNFLLCVLCLLELLACSAFGQDIRLNETSRITVRPRSPHRFIIPIKQGDRLRFLLNPVEGAAISTMITVYVDGQRPRFEYSGWKEQHDWTMSRIPPGDKVTVKIEAKQEGYVSLTVLKVDRISESGAAPAINETALSPQARANTVEERLNRIEQEITEIKRLIQNKEKP